MLQPSHGTAAQPPLPFCHGVPPRAMWNPWMSPHAGRVSVVEVTKYLGRSAWAGRKSSNSRLYALSLPTGYPPAVKIVVSTSWWISLRFCRALLPEAYVPTFLPFYEAHCITVLAAVCRIVSTLLERVLLDVPYRTDPSFTKSSRIKLQHSAN